MEWQTVVLIVAGGYIALNLIVLAVYLVFLKKFFKEF